MRPVAALRQGTDPPKEYRTLATIAAALNNNVDAIIDTFVAGSGITRGACDDES